MPSIRFTHLFCLAVLAIHITAASSLRPLLPAPTHATHSTRLPHRRVDSRSSSHSSSHSCQRSTLGGMQSNSFNKIRMVKFHSQSARMFARGRDSTRLLSIAKESSGIRESTSASSSVPMLRSASPTPRRRYRRIGQLSKDEQPPPDPSTLLSEAKMTQYADQLAQWLLPKSSVLCITGAGLSTESGIPDYRGHNGSYHRGHKPILHSEFMSSERRRQIYWGRSMVGWSTFHQAQPNRGHRAISQLEQCGKVGVTFDDAERFHRNPDDIYFSSGQQSLSVITQNVDSLHERSGSQHVVPLHGRGDTIRCMQCDATSERNEYQKLLNDVNEGWLQNVLRSQHQPNDALRPDGDAQISQSTDFTQVCVPHCPSCGTGILKPDVVFFGDTVPKHRVSKCQQAVQSADGILVVGTSLAVHSAFRHVRAAFQSDTPIAIVSVGPTRVEQELLPDDGSHPDVLKLEGPAGEILSRVADEFMRL